MQLHWILTLVNIHIKVTFIFSPPDLRDTDSILREFDGVIKGKISVEFVFGLLDGASLLWRLYLAGVDPGEERWKVVTDAMEQMIHNHQLPW